MKAIYFITFIIIILSCKHEKDINPCSNITNPDFTAKEKGVLHFIKDHISYYNGYTIIEKASVIDTLRNHIYTPDCPYFVENDHAYSIYYNSNIPIDSNFNLGLAIHLMKGNALNEIWFEYWNYSNDTLTIPMESRQFQNRIYLITNESPLKCSEAYFHDTITINNKLYYNVNIFTSKKYWNANDDLCYPGTWEEDNYPPSKLPPMCITRIVDSLFYNSDVGIIKLVVGGKAYNIQ